MSLLSAISQTTSVRLRRRATFYFNIAPPWCAYPVFNEAAPTVRADVRSE